MSKLDRLDPELLRTNPRASFAAWKKYEQLILAAYNTFPKPYIYKPSNMSASTVCTRARDAVRGAIAFSYSTDLDTTDLARWYSNVIFKHDNETVYIGPAEEITEALRGDTNNPSSTSTTLTFPTLSFEEVAAFTLLLSNSRIPGPVHISSPPDLSLLPQRPNVEMISRPDGSLLIL